MALEATCHCGDTRILLPEHPTEAGRCNCTFCQRTGAVWAYYDVGQIEVRQDLSQRGYGTNPAVGLHHFCGRCGMHTWGETADWSGGADSQGTAQAHDGPPRYSKHQVNLNLVDDLDWSKIKIEHMNGRTDW